MDIKDLEQQGLAVSLLEASKNNKFQQQQKQDDCPLCSQPSLQILISNALYHKYLDTQYINYLKYMDNIIDNEISKEAVIYKEMAIVDEQQEFMRRMYALSEYDYKNKAIVEYYKFHKDYPKLHIKGVSNIMEAYSDRKKQFQYKKIKRILKQQENISITTQKSSQIFSDIEDQDKKSNYSNVLQDMTQSIFFNEQNNESQVFQFMCKKIDKAFQNKPLSPINFKKKSIFDQGSNLEAVQTKGFINYLKKQQQKKERQEKYKNFIRSNKQSRYNSIEHENKQYMSGTAAVSTSIKNITRIKRQNPAAIIKGANGFYDGRIFYSNSNNKDSFGSISKSQRTKQQTNLNSQQNTEYEYGFQNENGFKKQKDSSRNNFNSKNERNLYEKKQPLFQTERQTITKNETFNLKAKQSTKTTQLIYKNATQQMRLKKRAFSYNSLANSNHLSKKSIGVANPLKQKDFEMRNRILSQGQRLLKDRNGFLNNQNMLNVNTQEKIMRSKSSRDIKTSRSVPKFYRPENNVQTQIKKNGSSVKKISVPKDIFKALKQKSYSTSKLKFNSESSSRSGNYVQNQGSKQFHKNLNLFIENGAKTTKYEGNNLIYTHHAAKNMDIDNLLNKKLSTKQEPIKNKNHKILI